MTEHFNVAAAKSDSRPARLTRRHFIVAGATAAGGLAVGIGLLPNAAEAFTVPAQPWAQPMDQEGYSPHDIDAWIAIEPDDSILIRYTRSEMGQGSMTALPMIVAEELQCDWSKVRVEYGSANRSYREHNIYGDMSSVGSHSVRDSHTKLQQVGASARERLIAAAAAQWGVPASECKAANSVVLHPASNRSVGYGAVASAAAQIKLDTEPAIKTPEQYTFIGKPQPRVDVPLKVNGSAQYSIDTRLPDMVYAAILQCPVPGGMLASVDDTPLKNAPGIVQVVRLQDAVAVVATDTFWRAKQGLAKLHPEWNVGAAGSTDSAQFAKEYRDAALNGTAPVARNDGNVDQALAAAGDKALSAVYEVPYLAHAPMEPMNATVHLQPDRLDVWVGTQSADRTLTAAAGVAGLKPEQVYIHNTFIGGGFGRKSRNDEMVQAIHIAKAINRPVKLIWTREDDIRHDRYRPQAAISFKGAVGADGMPTALYLRTAVGSILRSMGMNKVDSGIEPMAVEGLANHPYKIANSKVECALKNTHIPVSFWRSVGASQNAFAIESFIDELAHAGGQDPYRFRRTMLAGKPDWLGVLDMVAEKGDWGKPIESGRARGIAIFECYGTIVGEVAEITISPQGKLKVDKITLAADSGHVVNPLSFAEQMEGGAIFALTAALYGKVTVKNGIPEQGNFDTYPMVRLAQAPKIDVHLALSGGKKWGGAGEPGGAPTAAAVCNAIFALTGKRIRSLPLIDHDLSGSA
ncbi:MAG TPA: molybdopterin cofactor-binding domain-containing protein [Xanthobacteraceae bacterium]|nr:molybdopterin cofactor-binding domain-containing protein [Xanthobacteraceae bacterium]